ncbi:MAG: hypothetical protein H7843_01540 [Nitrospirota bacterium]
MPQKTNTNSTKIILFWLPHAAVIAALLSFSLMYFFHIYDKVLSGSSSKWLTTARALLPISVSLLASYVIFAILSKKYRNVIVANSIFIIVFYTLCIYIAEYIVPFEPLPPFEYSLEVYSKSQITLQRLIGRRLTIKDTHFRGAVHRESFNSTGWPDKERLPAEAGKRQIVFIGDSFLQVRSTNNAAWLVEEKLKPADKDIETINLSQDDTDPLDYRFRFYELAFDYNPAHVVIFLCLANDLDINYKYTPYKHEPFYVSDQAVLYLASRVERGVLRELIRLKNTNVLFADKGSLINALMPFKLPINKLNFIYLAVTAHNSASHGKAFPLEGSFPKLLATFCQLWQDRVSGTPPSIKAKLAAKENYRNYVRCYSLPKEQRLAAVAKLIAKQDNPELIVSKLSLLDEKFLTEFLQEPDMTYVSFPAIEKFVYNKPASFDEPSTQAVTEAVDNYMLLFMELQAEAARRNIGLTFVLIPETSLIDEEYYNFWLPLIDFRKKLGTVHALGTGLSSRLPAAAQTIDLNNYKNDFNMGYWHFDGHWNDKGNEAAAAIVSSYLKTAHSVDEPAGR